MECAVCYESFTPTNHHKPLVLACSHVLCRECVVYLANNPPSAKLVLCPFCKQPTPLHEGDGVDGLLASTAMLQLLENESPNQQNVIICGGCNQKVAEVYCQDCGANLCTQCSNSVHELKILSGHRRGPIVAADQDALWCNEHNKLFEVFCLECTKPICVGCVVGKCNGHKIASMNDTEEVRREELKENVSNLKALESELAMQSEQLTTQIEGATTWCASQLQILREEFAKIRVALDERERLVTQTIQNICNARTKSLALHKSHMDVVCNSVRSFLLSAKSMLVPSTGAKAYDVQKLCKLTTQAQQLQTQATQFCDVGAPTSGTISILAQQELASQTKHMVQQIQHLGKIVLLGNCGDFVETSDAVIQGKFKWANQNTSRLSGTSLKLKWELCASEHHKLLLDTLGNVMFRVVQRSKQPNNSFTHVEVFRGASSGKCQVNGIGYNTSNTFDLRVCMLDCVAVSVCAPLRFPSQQSESGDNKANANTSDSNPYSINSSDNNQHLSVSQSTFLAPILQVLQPPALRAQYFGGDVIYARWRVKNVGSMPCKGIWLQPQDGNPLCVQVGQNGSFKVLINNIAPGQEAEISLMANIPASATGYISAPFLPFDDDGTIVHEPLVVEFRVSNLTNSRAIQPLQHGPQQHQHGHQTHHQQTAPPARNPDNLPPTTNSATEKRMTDGLRELRVMGFDNEARMRALLTQHNLDVNRVAEALLDS